MIPGDRKVAKFYMTFKVHKDHEEGKAPPERPICSGSGSTFENVSRFVEHHIKDHATQHPTFIQDTPDFLEEINQEGELPDNATLVTIDVVGLFTNIPNKDGIEATREVLAERKEKEVGTEFLIRLLTLILENNFMEFNEEYYKQEIGAPMGSRPVPPYANIFMARFIDPKLLEKAKMFMKNGLYPIKFLKRFLNDLFLIWLGTTKSLHLYFEEINKIHPNIKFTMKHTTSRGETDDDRCSCQTEESIPFLDTSVKIKNDKLIVDLYKKATDRNQYLLTNSIHPPDCFKSIPFSLALRINRICSESETRNIRLEELKEFLIARKYKPSHIDAAIRRARAIPRALALKKVVKPKHTRRPVFSVTYDPRLPNLPEMQRRHWRSMTIQDEYLESVFPEPPLVAFKRQKNLSDFLIRAKLPPSPGTHEKRKLNGMKKCNKCIICPYITEGKSVKGRNFEWAINRSINCTSGKNIIYMIECNKENCKQRYIGETKFDLKTRISQHLG